MYKLLPYHVPSDRRVYRDTRRCMRQMYDKKDGRTTYVLAPMESIREPSSTRNIHERWVSPMCTKMREPYLLDDYYAIKEHELNTKEYPVGIKIQIYSIVNTINVITRYMIQLVSNEPKKWKRIMITYHLSEVFEQLPHIMDEIDLDEDDTRWRDTEQIKKIRPCWWL